MAQAGCPVAGTGTVAGTGAAVTARQPDLAMSTWRRGTSETRTIAGTGRPPVERTWFRRLREPMWPRVSLRMSRLAQRSISRPRHRAQRTSLRVMPPRRRLLRLRRPTSLRARSYTSPRRPLARCTVRRDRWRRRRQPILRPLRWCISPRRLPVQPTVLQCSRRLPMASPPTAPSLPRPIGQHRHSLPTVASPPMARSLHRPIDQHSHSRHQPMVVSPGTEPSPPQPIDQRRPLRSQTRLARRPIVRPQPRLRMEAGVAHPPIARRPQHPAAARQRRLIARLRRHRRAALQVTARTPARLRHDRPVPRAIARRPQRPPGP